MCGARWRSYLYNRPSVQTETTVSASVRIPARKCPSGTILTVSTTRSVIPATAGTQDRRLHGGPRSGQGRPRPPLSRGRRNRMGIICSVRTTSELLARLPVPSQSAARYRRSWRGLTAFWLGAVGEAKWPLVFPEWSWKIRYSADRSGRVCALCRNRCSPCCSQCQSPSGPMATYFRLLSRESLNTQPGSCPRSCCVTRSSVLTRLNPLNGFLTTRFSRRALICAWEA